MSEIGYKMFISEQTQKLRKNDIVNCNEIRRERLRRVKLIEIE